MKLIHRSVASAMLVALLGASSVAFAHGNEDHGKKSGPVKKEQKDWGIAGDAKAVRRTIEVKMGDNMRFSPDRIEVKQGETIRFIHRNDGKIMHEFVIGTKKELDEHAALMAKFPNMEHDEPYMAHVAPGKKGEMIWTFNQPGEFDFACLMAGHYEAGMVGKVKVAAAASATGNAATSSGKGDGHKR
ncbi:MAG: cupredoxin domain-containing protein [Burkholderiaceae bacterium]